MLHRVHAGGLLAGLLWAAAAVALNAQATASQNTDSQSKNSPGTTQSSAPCPAAQCAKSAQNDKTRSGEKFPFPGESPAPAEHSAPAAPAPPRTGTSADKKFPFPGDSGVPAAPAPEAGSSSSSSSSNDGEPNPADAAGASDASGKPELEDKGSEGQQSLPGRHILHRVNPTGTKLQSPDQRAAEDVDVAHFYMDSGDFQAAYLRGLDAVKVQPDEPSAHFVLAEAAMKLNKREEAIEQYRQCLKLDPIEKEAKAATKALNHLQAHR